MKRVIRAVVISAALLGVAAPVMAQTAGATAPAASAPSVNLFYVGALAGIGAVENIGPQVGGEAGFRIKNGFDVVAEGGWIKDVVSRRRLGLTTPVLNYLQTTQGKTAESTTTAPTLYGMAGIRWVWERESAVRPYVMATVGMATVEYKPTVTLAGLDITGSLPAYGVTLGSDLASKQTKAAFGGGIGVIYVRGQLYADAGLRLLSIATEGQTTNVTRAHIGLGVRF
ncbi:MAG: outer membrane beta-barrel protein [Acidobacteria bacterium]|nr:outer membrane beta-barrel protein [Acidobacteriota bacterium]